MPNGLWERLVNRGGGCDRRRRGGKKRAYCSMRSVAFQVPCSTVLLWKGQPVVLKEPHGDCRQQGQISGRFQNAGRPQRALASRYPAPTAPEPLSLLACLYTIR